MKNADGFTTRRRLPDLRWPLNDDRLVELATAYLNPSPQVKAAANKVPNLLSGPDSDPDPDLLREGAARPWALSRRLPEITRREIVAAREAGIRLQDLADQYDLSLSSIKRLIRAARRIGCTPEIMGSRTPPRM